MLRCPVNIWIKMLKVEISRKVLWKKRCNFHQFVGSKSNKISRQMANIPTPNKSRIIAIATFNAFSLKKIDLFPTIWFKFKISNYCFLDLLRKRLNCSFRIWISLHCWPLSNFVSSNKTGMEFVWKIHFFLKVIYGWMFESPKALISAC